MTAEENFNKYLNKIGEIVGDEGYVTFKILNINKKKLTAIAKIVSCPDYFGFYKDETVHLVKVDDEVWRMVNKKNKHGQAVFLGEYFGGIGFS
jgi:hypothetical protein